MTKRLGHQPGRHEHGSLGKGVGYGLEHPAAQGDIAAELR
jgi:hypothetical protein